MGGAAMMAPTRKAVKSVVLNLPIPTSTNRLWAKNERGIYKTSSYKAWIKEAGTLLETQHPGCVNGPYHLTIYVRRQPTKKHADLGNFEKGLSDLLQNHGVITNDKLAETIILMWVEDAAIDGCRVVVEAA